MSHQSQLAKRRNKGISNVSFACRFLSVLVFTIAGLVVCSEIASILHCDNVFKTQQTKINGPDNQKQLHLIHPSSCQVGDTSVRFDQIYDTGGWGSVLNSSIHGFYDDANWPPKLRLSFSGGGSNRGTSTKTSLAILKQLIAEHNISSMLDVPCGDVNWIFDSYETDFLPMYVGLDIVRSVIQLNNKRFTYHANKHFAWWDGVNCSFPWHRLNGTLQPFDMIHSRDIIQHLQLKDGQRFLCNVLLSGTRWFVTTTFNETGNKDILQGDWYANNLNAEPFNFPDVGKCKETHPSLEPDMTCVYDLSEDWASIYRKENCEDFTFVKKRW